MILLIPCLSARISQHERQEKARPDASVFLIRFKLFQPNPVMCCMRTLFLLTVGSLLFCLVRLSKLALEDQERLIRRHYAALEPDWRKYPPPSASTLTRKQQLEMPLWYGNSSSVGPSPYDFVPRPLEPGERKIHILFLLDFPDYLERMNSHSYEV